MNKKSKYVTYNYSSLDESIINDIICYNDENIDNILDFFDLDSVSGVNVYIKTKNDFDEIVKSIRKNDLEVPKWMVGLSDYNGNIYCVSLNDYKNTSHSIVLSNYDNALLEYKKMIIHEIVHHVNIEFCNKMNYPTPPKYLSEGIAQVLSNQKEKLKNVFNYSLEDILHSDNCYNGWYLLTKYILNNYSKEYYLSLFKNNEYANTEIKRIIDAMKNND